MSERLTATKVAQQLDISVTTLTNWYKWYNDPHIERSPTVPPLPEYEQAGARAPRTWAPEDIQKIAEFQKWLPKGRAGVMGEYNARFWGERGKRALKNKGL